MSSSSLPDSREMGLPRLRLMMLATLIALAVAVWYLATHRLRGDAEVAWYPADGPCQLHRDGCTATLGDDRKLHLAVSAPDGIRALAPLPLTVRLEGVEAASARVDLVGRDMDMGLHRFPLEGDGDRFQGLGQVSLCTESVMAWQARVVVETPEGRVGSRFDFTVERSSP